MKAASTPSGNDTIATSDDRFARARHPRQCLDEDRFPCPDMAPEKIGERFFLAGHRKFDDLIVLGCGFILAGKTRARLDAVKPHLIAQSHHHFGEARIVRRLRQQLVKVSIGLEIEPDVFRLNRARDLIGKRNELLEILLWLACDHRRGMKLQHLAEIEEVAQLGQGRLDHLETTIAHRLDEAAARQFEQRLPDGSRRPTQAGCECRHGIHRSRHARARDNLRAHLLQHLLP